MRRYAISGVIGSGTDQDMYRPAVADHSVSWSVAIANDHVSNPNKRWVLAVVAGDTTQLTELDEDSRCAVLSFGPDSLDNAWVTVGTAQERTRLSNRITQLTGVVVQRDDQRTLREIITLLGTTIDPNFSPESLNVADIY